MSSDVDYVLACGHDTCLGATECRYFPDMTVYKGLAGHPYPGFNRVVPNAWGKATPETFARAILEEGHVLIHRDGWPGGTGHPHFTLNGGRGRDHLDAFFCEVGWSGAADAENSDHAWWKLPRRQTAAEAHFGVPAGTLP